jgi:hypothetical protein
MPTRTLVFADLTVEDLTRCIKQWLEDDDRSTAWLAKKIGMADSTLRFQLDERPDRLLVANWLAILAALGRTWDDVRNALASEAEAA